MKKKDECHFIWQKNCLTKILLAMKFTILLLFLTAAQVFGTVYSQTKKLSIIIQNATVVDVLENIEAQSQFKFLYNDDLLDKTDNKTVNINDKTVYEILDEILSGTKNTYSVLENNLIVITPSDTEQGIKLTGKVTSEKGDPLVGATVLIKGTINGVTTDANGNYSLEIPSSDATIVASYIGFTTKEVKLNGETVLNISLSEDLVGLEEVVVVGYGTIKKSDITGSVASVSSEDLTIYPALDPIQAMQGMAAGVQVQSTNGEPGSGYSISIRGNTSINASSEPLIVVDGFPGATMPPPEDIESMEILKDASSTAIYGSRGANGVIMITTKSGKKGQFKIDLNTSISFQKEINRLEVLNAKEYVNYINEIDPDYYDNPSSYGEGTNWQDIVYRNGLLQNYQLSISGGTDKVNYYLSGNYYDHEGIIIGSEYKRYSFNSNITAQVLDWLNVGAKVFARRTDLNGVNSQRAPGSSRPGVPDMALKFMPTIGIYNEDGTYTITDRGLPADNPYSTAMAIQQERLTDLLQGNFFAELSLVKDLKFKTTFGVNSNSGRRGQYYPSTTYRGGSVDGEAGIEYAKHLDLVSENYFTYSSNFNEIHDLTAMAGYSYQNSVDDEMYIEGATGFPTDAFSYWNLGAASNTPIFDSRLIKTELSSIYGRFNYGYKSKYLFTFNARYDGSSVFAKNNKWAFFPSGAFAWDIKDEGFMTDVSNINQLKFRISYGITGNQAILPYQTLATLTDVFVTQGDNIISGIRPGSSANPNLTWESTAQTNIGLDMGLLESRISMTVDYYKMVTSDLLFNVPVPLFTGTSYQIQNIGKVENKGLELAINARVLPGQLKWTTNANISFNRNKILKLVENDTKGNDIYYSTSPVEGSSGIQTQILREGEPVGSFFGYVWDGVLQNGETALVNGETGGGAEKYKDITPDGTLDDKDRTIVGNPHPDFIWGWNNNLSYKNFDLNIFIQGQQGGDMINYTRMELGIMNGRTNALKEALDRWTPSNTDTDIPRAQLGRSFVFSDRWVEDASYIRLKNISLGYTFNESILNKIKIRTARIYVSAQNVLTLTNYKGVDAEVAYSSSNKNLGLDYASYPNTKSITVGVNLGF